LDGNLLPAHPEGQPKITVLPITVPPETSLPSHRHAVVNAVFNRILGVADGVKVRGRPIASTENMPRRRDEPAVTFSWDGQASRGRPGP
jgi:hypothetical protein